MQLELIEPWLGLKFARLSDDILRILFEKKELPAERNNPDDAELGPDGASCFSHFSGTVDALDEFFTPEKKHLGLGVTSILS